jgi:pimeloyl-ACP methyl ester carboxylesterase
MLSARVEIKGVEVAYRQWGTADTPTLVIAHGLPGAQAWTKLAEELQDVRRVLAFDLPGFGASTDVPRGFDHTINSYGAIFDGFVETLGLERFDLAVHDISGGYALPYAGLRRDQLGSLILLNTQAFAGWRWHSLARRYRTPVLGRLMSLRPPRSVFEKLLRPAFAGEPPRWYLDGLWEAWTRGPTRRATMRFYRRNEPEMWGAAERALPKLKGVPSVVVWGQVDPFVHPSAADRLSEALAAPVVRLPATGHFPMVERPVEVAAAARTVLS